MANRLECFCQEPCKSYKTDPKNGDPTTWLKCGTKINYKELYAELKKIKGKVKKNKFLRNQPLGCILNVKEDDDLAIEPDLWQFSPKVFPKCSGHDVFVKMGISHSEDNDGRTFFSCAVAYPNIPCDYFAWADDCINQMKDYPMSDEEEEEEEKHEERPKNRKRTWKQNNKKHEESKIKKYSKRH